MNRSKSSTLFTEFTSIKSKIYDKKFKFTSAKSMFKYLIERMSAYISSRLNKPSNGPVVFLASIGENIEKSPNNATKSSGNDSSNVSLNSSLSIV